jgi:hypothetical protein
MRKLVLVVCSFVFFSAIAFGGDLTREDFLQIKKDTVEIKQSVALLSKKVDELSTKLDKVLESPKKVVGAEVVKDETCVCKVVGGIMVCPDGTQCVMIDGKCVCVGKAPVAATAAPVTRTIVGYRTERQCDGDTCRTVQVPIYSSEVVPATYTTSSDSGTFSVGPVSGFGSCGSSSSGRLFGNAPVRTFFRGLFGGCGG